MSTRETSRIRQIQTLELASRLGWICAPVLSCAFWPKATARRKYAERLIASMVKRGWLEKVEKTSPTAYVLTRAARTDYEAFTNASGNPSKLDRPTPPGPTYQHDIRAASALLFMLGGMTHDNWLRVVFDREIKADNTQNKARKRPDGILTFNDGQSKGYWVEVENSHKTGPNMRKQVDELIAITMAGGKGERWLYTRHGKTAPVPCVILAVPEGYNMEAFRNRVQKQLDLNDRGEQATFRFIEDTKDGFKLHPTETIKAANTYDEAWDGPR